MNKDAESDALEPNPLIIITEPIIVFKLLRNFGHLIRNLGINFAVLEAKICTEFENYLIKYCSDTLQRFSLGCNMRKFLFVDLKKPFKKMIALKIRTILKQKQDHIQFFNETNFPNVNHLIIYDCGGNLQNSEKIHYENIKYFTYFGLHLKKFPFSFKSLEHLILSYIIIDDDFFDFVGNNKHLKTLKIWKIVHGGKRNWLRNFSELPNIQSNLVELSFEFNQNVCVDEIFLFVKQCRQLKKLSFHQENHDSRDFEAVDRGTRAFQTISSELGAGWRSHIIDPYTISIAFYKHISFSIERIID